MDDRTVTFRYKDYLDPSGHFTGLRKGAMRVRLKAGQPPAIWDSS